MKLNKNSMGVKLWLYFILFAAVILSALWLMQIVFMQSFYEGMKTNEVEKVAEELAQAYGGEDFESIFDRAAFANSILVYVTDRQGNILYATDQHGPGGLRPDSVPKGAMRKNDLFRPLPADYTIFLEKLLESSDGRINYKVDWHDFRGESLVCGVLLPDAALYISTPLEPVDATAGILRTQLAYITLVALILSFVIAYFISRKFSRPVAAITTQAKELARGDFPERFDQGFCSELDELADALTHASAELSKVEKLRRELIANISHDLRTPLTMIRAYSEMIRDISGDDKEKREAHLRVIAGETDRLANLVDDILALSSIQSGNESIAQDNLNLSDTARRILSRFEPIFAHEGYVFETSIEPDQYVWADGKKIEQVLYNLIGNAMNHIGEDRVIAVKVSNLGGWARVEVGDHGEGIPQDEVALIWDRYYRSSRERGKTGAGLGLSIVKGILEMHGARFGVDSSIGEGSTFWFELKK